MDRKIYKLLSESISSMGSTYSNELSELITDSTMKNIKIYQRNYFGLFVNTLSDKYLASYRFIESNNFNYLVKQFITESPYIGDSIKSSCEKFYLFISESIDIHSDKLLVSLSQLDHLWSFGIDKTIINLPVGSLDLWLQLVDDELDIKDINFEINLLELEEVELKMSGDEKMLVKQEEIKFA